MTCHDEVTFGAAHVIAVQTDLYDCQLHDKGSALGDLRALVCRQACTFAASGPFQCRWPPPRLSRPSAYPCQCRHPSPLLTSLPVPPVAPVPCSPPVPRTVATRKWHHRRTADWHWYCVDDHRIIPLSDSEVRGSDFRCSSGGQAASQLRQIPCSISSWTCS